MLVKLTPANERLVDMNINLPHTNIHCIEVCKIVISPCGYCSIVSNITIYHQFDKGDEQNTQCQLDRTTTSNGWEWIGKFYVQNTSQNVKKNSIGRAVKLNILCGKISALEKSRRKE